MARSTEHGWRVSSERAWLSVYAFAKQRTANCFAIRLTNGGVVVLSPALGVSAGAYADLTQLGEVTARHNTLAIGAFRQHFSNAGCALA